MDLELKKKAGIILVDDISVKRHLLVVSYKLIYVYNKIRFKFLSKLSEDDLYTCIRRCLSLILKIATRLLGKIIDNFVSKVGYAMDVFGYATVICFAIEMQQFAAKCFAENKRSQNANDIPFEQRKPTTSHILTKLHKMM